MNINLDLTKIVDIQFADIDHKDYPDYSDAYIYEAYIDLGDGLFRNLVSYELDWLNNQRDFVYEKLMDYIH